MGSSFEDLIARGLTVKTDCNFDTRFTSYDFLNFLLMKLNAHVDYFWVIRLAVCNFIFLGIEDFPFMGECLDVQTGTRMLPSLYASSIL
jgi:hypothetical protein